jgi:15-cis-phytoene synthase
MSTLATDPSADPSNDVSSCEELMRGGSKSFFAASRVLPQRVRSPAIALYAFCRLADDAIDFSADKHGAMIELRERLHRLYSGNPYPIAADRALSNVVSQFNIPLALPAALLEGFEWDAQGKHYETIDDLYDYGTRVAGTVGAMMALIMGTRNVDALARACELGVAMQLTNIARDVGEDALAGRLYLPLAWMREAGIDPDAWLREPTFNSGIAGIVARLLQAADDLYERAGQGIAALPRDCRPAIQAARLIYAEIGREIERAGMDSVSRRAIVSSRRKSLLMVEALAAAVKNPMTTSALLRPLPAVQFLVNAVQQTPSTQVATTTSIPPKRGLFGRAIWVADLFDRLAERDREISLQNRRRSRDTAGNNGAVSIPR